MDQNILHPFLLLQDIYNYIYQEENAEYPSSDLPKRGMCAADTNHTMCGSLLSQALSRVLGAVSFQYTFQQSILKIFQQLST